jgi:hypothetical protein
MAWDGSAGWWRWSCQRWHVRIHNGYGLFQPATFNQLQGDSLVRPHTGLTISPRLLTREVVIIDINLKATAPVLSMATLNGSARVRRS